MAALESLTPEVADAVAADQLPWRRGIGSSGARAALGGADDWIPRVHRVAHGVTAGHGQGLYRRRARPRRHAGEAVQEVDLGFRQRGASPRRDDLGRVALAKHAGVSPDGSGSHRLMIGTDVGAFADPDGFAWEAAPL